MEEFAVGDYVEITHGFREGDRGFITSVPTRPVLVHPLSFDDDPMQYGVDLTWLLPSNEEWRMIGKFCFSKRFLRKVTQEK